jgi:hypothetical protein
MNSNHTASQTSDAGFRLKLLDSKNKNGMAKCNAASASATNCHPE